MMFKAITIRQPWAHLIVTGIKPVENRTWRTAYRGLLLIHAGAARDRKLIEQHGLDPELLQFGAVIGAVYLTDIVTAHRSRFFTGPFGWVLSRPRPIRPVPLKGQLSLFSVSGRQLLGVDH